MIEGIRWKFVAVVGVIAMAVSLLSGGLAGIRFGMLLMRALLGGTVFTVFAVGLNLFIVRFFPELFEAETSYAGDADDISLGSRVDIVMPAEEPGSPSYEPVGADSEGLAAEGGSPAVSSSDGGAIGEAEAGGGWTNQDEASAVGDLDRFSADFAEADDGAPDSNRRRESSVPGGDREPQELAQAIQTVMKRDKKG